MKATIDRKSFLSAFAVVSAVAPARSPKPILQNVKLDVGEGGEAGADVTDNERGAHVSTSLIRSTNADGRSGATCGGR